MRKIIVGINIIVVFVMLQACSKKETSLTVTGYEGEWTGKIPAAAPDSIQLNLKLGGSVDGKLLISPFNGAAVDTIHGNWSVTDTLITIATISTQPQRAFIFLARANKNTLDGQFATNLAQTLLDFHLARKK